MGIVESRSDLAPDLAPTRSLKCGTCHVLVTLPGGRCWIGEGHRDTFADAGGRAYSRRTQGTSWHTPSERGRGAGAGWGERGEAPRFQKEHKAPETSPQKLLLEERRRHQRMRETLPAAVCLASDVELPSLQEHVRALLP